MSEARCGTCGRTWRALGQAHCKGGAYGGCCQHFNSDSAFDRHRKNFTCIPVEEFGELIGKKNPQPRLVPIEHPQGVIWATARREGV